MKRLFIIEVPEELKGKQLQEYLIIVMANFLNNGEIVKEITPPSDEEIVGWSNYVILDMNLAFIRGVKRMRERMGL